LLLAEEKIEAVLAERRERIRLEREKKKEEDESESIGLSVLMNNPQT
jgi:hypothetical protein